MNLREPSRTRPQIRVLEGREEGGSNLRELKDGVGRQFHHLSFFLSAVAMEVLGDFADGDF